MAKKYAPIFAAACFASLVWPCSSFSETIRSRAETHFSSLGWTDDPSLVAPVERKAVAIPGGDETFPAMTPTGDTGIVSVYPELEGLGKLDYTALDANLLSVLSRASEGFKNREVAASLCDPRRSFLAPVNTFRLKKIPEVQSVRFARPAVDTPSAASGNASASEASTPASVTCRFRLMCAGSSGEKSIPLFLSVRASRQADSWFISDIDFDGKTYAELTVQN